MLDQTNLEAPGLPLTVRAVFIIDPSKIIRLIIYYPASTGRNFNEIFRVLDSLQLASKSVATPANWEPGQDVVVVPSVPTEKAKEIFGEVKVRLGRNASRPNLKKRLSHTQVIRPYLRMVKQPQP